MARVGSAREAEELAALRGLIAPWAETWAVGGLEQRLRITFSGRFRSSLGRCHPRSGEIRLAAFLRTGPVEVLREVLCHEAAHAAAYELHGLRARPHGKQWRALMKAAGFEPRACLPASVAEKVLPNGGRPRKLVEHRCPVCHATRLARRRMPAWRCASCRALGLAGLLGMRELEAEAARSALSASSASPAPGERR